MAIRLSGMVSGLDTDALVKELVSAYSTKKDKYVKQKTKLEWKQDAWKSLNTSTYSFYTNKLSNMRFSTNYSKKKVVSSNENKALVSASSTAVNGTQKLKVNSLATTGYLTGAEILKDGEKASYTGKTKLSDMGFSGNGNISVTVDGKEHTFSVGENTTINNVVTQLKTAGLHASFDEKNQRFFISSQTSGKDADFAMTGDSAGVEAMKSMGIFAVTAADKTAYGKKANMDTEKAAKNEYFKVVVNNRNAVLNNANNKLNSEIDYLSHKDDRNKSLTEKIDANDKKVREKLGLADDETIDYAQLEKIKDGTAESSSYEAYDKLSDEDKKEVMKLLDNHTAYEKTKDQYKEYDDALGAASVDERVTALKGEIEENKTQISANNELAKKTYTVAEFDSNADIQALIQDYESSDTQTAKYDDIKAKYDDMKAQAEKILAQTANGKPAEGTSDVSRIEGKDSEIELNGAIFKSNSNTYSINGLTITAMGVTDPNEEISITTETDVDGIYDMVKDFFKSYNEVMTAMQTAYNADSSKGYEPLTDEEKEAMSDDEVEKWEKKIKDSLLRRDDTLGGIISAMQVAMSTSYTVNGKSVSLSTFGIATAGYFNTDAKERGTYHIDGDKDDATTAGNADKLRAAIAEDPDSFVEAFSKITDGLYTTLTKKMSRSSMSSAYTIYNDKYMKKQQEDLEDTIKKWEQKVSDYEDKYYKQFSAMETALSKLQSQTSSLTGLLNS